MTRKTKREKRATKSKPPTKPARTNGTQHATARRDPLTRRQLTALRDIELTDDRDALVRRPYVLAKLGGISRHVLKSLIDAGKVPAGIQISDRIEVWHKAEIDAIVREAGRSLADAAAAAK